MIAVDEKKRPCEDLRLRDLWDRLNRGKPVHPSESFCKTRDIGIAHYNIAPLPGSLLSTQTLWRCSGAANGFDTGHQVNKQGLRAALPRQEYITLGLSQQVARSAVSHLPGVLSMG
ncbi:hypothetical protein SCLCIDRAFT_1064303 [Scleroderma citrinum Foug A]|uniref:Uncharacterized protein n=1 Tax=Scleroderma citrinum Foug A TaxID=1036808 RepID=A0A0C3E4F8_9AGAM|nr:hypothetical protein SCLCIDRAFT_1064303 [Scleroderma citrinum Foug A]